jgi:hypothetical protein
MTPISEKKKEKYFCAEERSADRLESLGKDRFWAQADSPLQWSCGRGHAGQIEQLHYLPICPSGGALKAGHER